ncbi:spondin-2-like isoform X1 [Maniola hyperantus]|uniref:spondin-2-like isoform X1 n=1 Tax=Aphantopus hyperantus TaxID=2795564 RepID=UPI00156831A5|nr:spondin-2-like [Maniola hyperantus]
MYIKLILLLVAVSFTSGLPGVCDQTPRQAKVLTPSENKGYYRITIDTKNSSIYGLGQTYIIILESIDRIRPFRWFMITVEDASLENNTFDFDHRSIDVGSLKTLDSNSQARYSERCYNTVENSDNSEKFRVEIHWVSPKENLRNRDQTVRLRAMVAENEEIWYTGDDLTLVLKKDDSKPLDQLPTTPMEYCGLCSEARYEVTFRGQWSRMLHPQQYPTKPDENEYSNLIGASHAFGFTLWQPGDNASPGLKMLAETASVAELEREIINAMSTDNGTRTLIRGKRRRHPYMSEPSDSIFRVDRIHHMVSVVIAIKPSPDWFLGVTRFELCTKLGWLEEGTIPLYPWDAGVRDGISYESPTSVTTPVDAVSRVAFGSFDKQSPFYQMNLNDLKPFAYLNVRRLEVYPLNDNCEEEEGTNIVGDQEQEDQAENLEKDIEEPLLQPLKVRTRIDCVIGEWTEWSQCVPDAGTCGPGTQIRTRGLVKKNLYSQVDVEASPEVCRQSYFGGLTEFQECFVNCV